MGYVGPGAGAGGQGAKAGVRAMSRPPQDCGLNIGGCDLRWASRIEEVNKSVLSGDP
jgi:hypothetical protein